MKFDRFILARLEATGRALSAPADAATLIRRLDTRPHRPASRCGYGAGLHRRFIGPGCTKPWWTGYLQSPRYGEKQAQHWLDLARFAESDGFEHDIGAQACLEIPRLGDQRPEPRSAL